MNRIVKKKKKYTIKLGIKLSSRWNHEKRGSIIVTREREKASQHFLRVFECSGG